ncbi:MAG: dTDP-4-dehydrorhamnose 3,5-epimerase family protein, partial [Gammaproteobacteria bacterium]
MGTLPGRPGIDCPVKFVETDLVGVFVVEPEILEDDRGFFARSWCEEEFARAGLKVTVSQANISFNKRAGT